jgi:hypothetical protein
MEPPDPMPNSEVKRISVDDSVGPPHVKVDHPQGFILRNPAHLSGVFALELMDE